MVVLLLLFMFKCSTLGCDCTFLHQHNESDKNKQKTTMFSYVWVLLYVCHLLSPLTFVNEVKSFAVTMILVCFSSSK